MTTSSAHRPGPAGRERRAGRQCAAGGWIAGLATTRLTYFLTVPFAALSVVAYCAFPRAAAAQDRRARPRCARHLAVTYRTLIRGGQAAADRRPGRADRACPAKLVFEFGPLWLVALGAPAVLYGPYWAALTSTLGLGGLLAGQATARPAAAA